MALNVGSLPVTGVYAGSTEVQKVYVGADLVWENWETVTITGTSGTEARDSFRAALSARGLDYRTVETVPFLLDTSNVTNMRTMFYECAALTSVPDMNTSNVTSMSYMFRGCSSLTSVPDMDTSNVTDMSYMFGECSSLSSVPDMDTSNVTTMRTMFQRCSSLSSVSDMDTSNVEDMSFMFWGCEALTDGNVRLIGKKDGVKTRDMIDSSGLTRLPFYDTNGGGGDEVPSDPGGGGDNGGGGDEVVITGTQPKEARDQLRAALTDRGLDYTTVTEIPFDLDTSKATDMNLTFSGCSSLTTVPQMDTSNVTKMASMFDSCSSLTTVPQMDTSNVTNMTGMFSGCSSLTTVPQMDTSSVTSTISMFYNCTALTDGNVRCIGKKDGVNTYVMIDNSGLTRLPFYDTNGNWTG